MITRSLSLLGGLYTFLGSNALKFSLKFVASKAKAEAEAEAETEAETETVVGAEITLGAEVEAELEGRNRRRVDGRP